MHECFLKHSRMGTARMNNPKESEEEGKQIRVNMERSKVGKKKKIHRPNYSLGLQSPHGRYSKKQ